MTAPRSAAGPALLVLGGLLAAGCGGPRNGVTLEDCLTRHAVRPRTTFLPACVLTARGAMPVESEYLPGVLQCEVAGVIDQPAALEAQAIAARTYLAAWLERRGEDAVVPLGPSFQCWRPPRSPAAFAAVRRTADIVAHHDATLISANYAAGTRRLRADCTPRPPADSGYAFESWEAMRDHFVAERDRGRRPRYGGTDWTEILVTRNEGRSGAEVRPTPMGRPVPWNRGALGQWAARCLAEAAGYDTLAILRYFYGADVRLSAPLPPEPAEPDPEATPVAAVHRTDLDDEPVPLAHRAPARDGPRGER